MKEYYNFFKIRIEFSMIFNYTLTWNNLFSQLIFFITYYAKDIINLIELNCELL